MAFPPRRQIFARRALPWILSGNIYIGQYSGIREVNHNTGYIYTIVGSSTGFFGDGGYSGDGGPAAEALSDEITDLAVDGQGNVVFMDGYGFVREVNRATGVISTIAGNKRAATGSLDYGFSGDGGPAVDSQLNEPEGIAIDNAGNIFISDWSWIADNGVIREINPTTGVITTIAGGDDWPDGYESDGDGGPAFAGVFYPGPLGIDEWGDLYLADPWNGIRVISGAVGYNNSATWDSFRLHSHRFA